MENSVKFHISIACLLLLTVLIEAKNKTQGRSQISTLWLIFVIFFCRVAMEIISASIPQFLDS